MPRSDTRGKILDAAEQLIIDNGYAATSLRAIANRAEVNLAATHYHFGSKMGLLAAVFHRRIEPIDAARQKLLDELENSTDTPTVREIVEAFLAPIKQAHQQESLRTLPHLVGRIFGEPESITKPLIENEFAELAARYQTALGRALPHLSRDELQWRFHFMVGSMVHLLRMHAPVGQSPTDASLGIGLEHLINYTVAGFTQLGERT